MKVPDWVRRWPDWVGYATAAWSFAYGALGVLWAAGGPGFPFGLAHDSGAHLSVFAGATPETGGRIIAFLGLGGAGLALLLARTRRPERFYRTVYVAWLLAVILCFVVPDFRVLTTVAYAPILILGAPFGWPKPVRLADVLPWPVLNQAVCIVGGMGWAATALAFGRRARHACVRCGREPVLAGWQAPDAARRWGRWAVVVAVIVPVFYAATRYAWAAGIRLGLTEKFFRQGQAIGLWWIGAALGTLAMIGAGLTLGLTRPWGEVFPQWVPSIGGRRVPPALAIVPAAIVSVIVMSAGLMFVRMAILGTFKLGDNPVTFTENWAALWPELFWPMWGVALALAALAYHYRTRGRCPQCGRA